MKTMKTILAILFLIVSGAISTDLYASFTKCINRCDDKRAECIATCATKPKIKQLSCQTKCDRDGNTCDRTCQSLKKMPSSGQTSSSTTKSSNNKANNSNEFTKGSD